MSDVELSVLVKLHHVGHVSHKVKVSKAHGVDGGADRRGGLALLVHEARDAEVGKLRDEAEWRHACHRVLLRHKDVARL